MVLEAKSLTPDQKMVVEQLPGRPLAETQRVSVETLESEAAALERRKKAAAGLRQYFEQIDSTRKPISDEEADEIFIEAMRSSRPGYREI